MDTVYWTSLCGNYTQYNALWSSAITLNTTNPDLTVCLQRVFFTLPQAALLVVAMPVHICSSKRSWKCGICNFTCLNLVKTLLCLVMVLASLVMVATVGRPNPEGTNSQTPADLVATIVRFLTLVMAFVLIRWEYMKDIFSSGVLPMFWLISLILEIFQCRSNVIRMGIPEEHPDVVYFVASNIFFALLIMQFLLTFTVDRPRSVKATSDLDRENLPLLRSSESSNEMVGCEHKETNLAKPCPHELTCYWSRVTFQWLTWDVIQGSRKTITFDKLYELRLQDKCKTLLNKFYSYRVKTGTPNKSTSHPALWRVLYHCVSWDFSLSIILRVVSIPITFINPQLLSVLIYFIENSDPHEWKGIMLAVFMLVNNLVSTVFTNNFLFYAFSAGMKTRSIITAVVFQKVLRLSSSARRQVTSGHVVSLMSVDAARVQEMYAYSTLLWIVPVIILLATFFLWQTMGLACLAGLGVIGVLAPLNAVYLARKAFSLQKLQMALKDQRFRVMNEILSGMKVLKFNAWEPSFEKKVSGIREHELSTIKYVNYIDAFGSVCWLLTPYLVSLATFTTYILMDPDNVLTAAKAFVTLALINLLHFPVNFLPTGVAKTAQGIVSVRRVARFLEMDELEQDAPATKPLNHDAMIEVHNGTFSWDKKAPPTLHDINLTVPRGSLVAIVGAVGSGKSSLINCILGEMFRNSGEICCNGHIAYVPQQAWLIHGSLKQNILLGKPEDNKQYEKILAACNLEPDIGMLAAKDHTEIGERGINLSGGQKQRVSLARAMYQDEDIYLLDDPLSAVDCHISKHIFDNVIGPAGLMQYKTRVLVTHGITYLPMCDIIVVLSEGRITNVGNYETLLMEDGVFSDIVQSFVENKEAEVESTCQMDYSPYTMSYESSSARSITGSSEWEPISRRISHQRKRPFRRGKAAWMTQIPVPRNGNQENERREEAPQLVEEELEEKGTTKLTVIMSYVKACGYVFVNFIVWSHILFIASQVGTYIWLAKWTEDQMDDSGNGTNDRNLAIFRLSVYGYLGVGQLVLAMAEAFLLAQGCYSASRMLHERLLHRILRAPMAFFDRTPLGRIMNRFLKDIDLVDMSLLLNLRQFLFASAPVLVIAVLICYATPIIVSILIPVIIIYLIIQRLFIVANRQWKRIDAVRHSPIYTHFDETMSGVSSVRAYRRVEAYTNKCEKLIDESQRSGFLLIVANRWSSVVVDCIGAGVVFFASLFAVLDPDITSSMAGLSVSFSLTVTVYLSSIIRTMSELEKNMVSVERLEEYSNIDTEAPLHIPGYCPPDAWPEVGAIQFRSFSTRYRAGLDRVLSDIDLYIRPGEKVGIVGRTGAGKSTLVASLFRLTEATSGAIYIDNLDVSTMGLHDLRARISILPQDPMVFSGSLRSNVDPFGDHDDLAIWQALQHANLTFVASDINAGLQYECGENGEALSIGQRQLLCLARVLLRQSKILVLDEATAAVDFETDAMIQSTIREKFKHCTILTVAHRLQTIMDYDRIIVLENGRIVEDDSPSNLLTDLTTTFYAMARDAGLV